MARIPHLGQTSTPTPLWFSVLFLSLILSGARCDCDLVTVDNDEFNETRTMVIMERTPHNDYEKYFIPFMRDFEAFLCYTNYVVDKSLLIEKIMERPEDIIVISAPMIFGKTLNLGMMRLFLEPQTYDGVRRIREQNIGYRFFKRGQYPHPTADEHRFSGRPLIRDHKEFFNQHQGMYPVVYLNFKYTQFLYNFTQIIDKLSIQIGEIFQDYFYMRQGYFSRIINRANSTQEMKDKALADWRRFKAIGDIDGQNATTLVGSIAFLIETLAKFFDHKAVLMIDEMDYLVNMVKEDWVYDDIPYPWELETQVMDFLSEFIDITIRNNKYLAKTIVVGETQSCITELFADLAGRMKRYDAVNNDFAEFFGFTKTVAKKLMQIGNVSDDLAAQALDWYDGYRFNRKSTQTVLCPWDIIRLIETKTVKNFWENDLDIRLRTLMALDGVRPVIERLIKGETIPVAWDTVRFSAKEFVRLEALVSKKVVHPGVTDMDLVLKRLCAAGYVTFAGTQYDADFKRNLTLVAAPNKEVINEFKTILDVHSKENPYTVFR
ncbi:uncharacterized protein LOC135838507 [Planococcus citri]|uniref:uncharacterized protein LOC135838507 n=1 Tax=Planococcus citri TaxID=170843 RepID=UPI0031F97F5C